jgi:type II secretory ATPase GspE/PulE/Tfp pilus assembly ATPase PilB-like protein
LLELLQADDETGVADAVDVALSQGAYHRASDIHLEPWTDSLSLRYRLDGILQQIAIIPKDFQPKIIARIKVLSELVCIPTRLDCFLLDFIGNLSWLSHCAA